jgi:hypothetical protein
MPYIVRLFSRSSSLKALLRPGIPALDAIARTDFAGGDALQLTYESPIGYAAK